MCVCVCVCVWCEKSLVFTCKHTCGQSVAVCGQHVDTGVESVDRIISLRILLTPTPTKTFFHTPHSCSMALSGGRVSIFDI